jgi:uncharacterized protein (DUF4415 family)
MKKEYNLKDGKRGQVVPQKGKTRITIYLDNDVLEEFRNRSDAAGHGYQTMINEALKQYLEKSGGTLNEAVIRRVIREELDKSAVH